MYTKCPQCEKQRTIKAEELRFSRGIISCEECASLFNAFELLQAGAAEVVINDTSELLNTASSDDAIPDTAELLQSVSNEDAASETAAVSPASLNEDFIPDASLLLRTDAAEDVIQDKENNQNSIPEQENTRATALDVDKDDEFPLFEKAPKKRTKIWGLAFSGCLILLGFQLYFFEGYGLTQNPTLRPWLKKICKPFKCQLPGYKNLDEFTILHGSFEPVANKKHYIFKATFVNQADFIQNHPSIKLILQNFNGQIIAERVFHPKDYLKNTVTQIKPEASAEISLNIVAPSKKMGGYSFELI